MFPPILMKTVKYCLVPCEWGSAPRCARLDHVLTVGRHSIKLGHGCRRRARSLLVFQLLSPSCCRRISFVVVHGRHQICATSTTVNILIRVIDSSHQRLCERQVPLLSVAVACTCCILLAAQVCKEAGGRVGIDRFVRDLDYWAFNGLDQRRIEVIVDGLTLHEAQLAVDTILVSPLHGDGSARRNAATTSGVALTCPELTGEGGRARLIVLAAEVGAGGTRKLLSSLELWFCRVVSQQHT